MKILVNLFLSSTLWPLAPKIVHKNKILLKSLRSLQMQCIDLFSVVELRNFSMQEMARVKITPLGQCFHEILHRMMLLYLLVDLYVVEFRNP